MSFSFAEISKELNNASTDATGVSFNAKSLKLNSEEDAEEVCDAIKKCSRLDYLDLEGNTLGPDAAKAISQTLAAHGSHLKRALWKDMFTGRMKTEIPKALEYLGNGLNSAGASLVELDLSDNAFGPIGVQGLAALLSSSPCYTLQKLRLNNNGLGITGGKLLAKALLDCHANSTKAGKPLALKVFVAGRNRLENEGATALAAVFSKLGTLEEVVMPQNGIYHPGVAALVDGLAVNPGLKVLNLNDNTVGPIGSQALADVLHNFPALEHLNLGDCLLKTKGAIIIANALSVEGNHPSLVELDLTFNEIRTRAADFIARAMTDKMQLTKLSIDGNFFGEFGRTVLTNVLTDSGRIDALNSLDEDASDEEESDYEEAEPEEPGEDEDLEHEIYETNGTQDSIQDVSTDVDEKSSMPTVYKQQDPIEVKEFLKHPTGENLLLLQGDKITNLLESAKSSCQGDNTNETTKYLQNLLPIVMKVSSLCGSGYVDVRLEAEQLTDSLYSELFNYATKTDQMSLINNNLLVNLGLIKGEDRSSGKIDWNLEGCFKALEKVCQQDYFPTMTKDILKVFIEKPLKPSRVKIIDPFLEAKTSLKNVIDQAHKT